MSDDRTEIEVSVPADPVYIRVVRLAASGVASLVGLDVEKIEDVKIAVDEMCSTLIEVGTGTPLRVRFAPPVDGTSVFRVEVEAGVDLDAGRDEHRFALSRTILGAIADHHELVVTDDGTGRYSMTMRVESITGEPGPSGR
jgi:serine/threonine-protein kinase RsbW